LSLWNARNQALYALEGNLQQEAEIIQTTFVLIDECIDRLSKVDSPFARVCGLTLVKARNLAWGSFSLMLDGLGQEAGALLRPLIETLELLIYFRQEPSRVELAINGKLPQAGGIAKTIKGEFQELRKYLNRHASHFGFTIDSLRHVVDFQNLTWKTTQPYNESVLRTNLGSLFAFLIQLAIEGASCLSLANALLDNEFADSVENHRDKGISIFLGIHPNSGE
jgi:hypothetical protein